MRQSPFLASISAETPNPHAFFTIRHSRVTSYSFKMRGLLVLDVLPQILCAGLPRVEVTRGIGRDTFGHAGRLVFGAEGRDKGCDLAVSGAADANSRPDTPVVFCVRLGIRHVNGVVAIDEDPARPAELLPLRDEIAILVEDLNAVVAAVADEEPPLRIDCDRMRRVELPGTRAFPAPRLDEFSILREFHDARVGVPAMPIGDEDVTVRRGDNVAWPIKRVGPVAGNSSLAERHQHFSIGAEFEYLVAFAVLAGGVARPDVAVAVHVEAVRLIEHPLPKHL